MRMARVPLRGARAITLSAQWRFFRYETAASKRGTEGVWSTAYEISMTVVLPILVLSLIHI